MERSSRRARPPRRTDVEVRRGPRIVGLTAALRAAGLGLLAVVLPVLLVWAADSRSGVDAAEALRSGGRIWLLAHGASLELSDGRVALTPLGLLLLPLWLVAGAATSAARASVPTTVRAGPAAGALDRCPVRRRGRAGGDGVDQPHGTRPAGAGAGRRAARGGGRRAARRAAAVRLWRAAWHLLPARGRRLLRGALGATAVLVGAGALLVAGSLAMHGERAAELAAASDPGAAGGAGCC
jgi:hypothetical protein